MTPMKLSTSAARYVFRSHFALISVTLALVLASASLARSQTAGPLDSTNRARVTLPFDSDWRFLKADAQGAEQPDFNDTDWRRLDLPHDWSIEGPFSADNPTTGSGGFLPAGVGWYRKRFQLPAQDAHRVVFVEFDGVMANSDVWINGVHLGKRPFGYASFIYELTGHLRFGPDQENVLAVRADNSAQPASRWYAGAGIYRHVRLIIQNPVHLVHWGVFLTTPTVTADRAVVHIQTAATNQTSQARDITLHTVIVAPDGQPAARDDITGKLPPGQGAVFEQDIAVDHPRLWDLNHPRLYQAFSQLREGSAALDDQVTSFGVRTFRFDPNDGFFLNGQAMKIKGVCLHHGGGALGAAVPLGVWQRRFERLRQAGCNAIRTAHNPVAPEFLDLADRLGFIVMDEMFDCWTVGKRSADYHLFFRDWWERDLRDTVRRDRNHPSVIIYSAGNEIRDTPHFELASGIITSMIKAFHQEDPSRPVTMGLFRPNVSHDYDNGFADILDVVGQNYRENEILAAHHENPARKILGTENGHDRRVWLALRHNPPYAGQFLWTGIDYLGEARSWPFVGAGSGLFDRTGRPHPRAFERQSWWSDEPMVHIVRRVQPSRATPADPGFTPLNRRPGVFSDWTPANTPPHDENVEVYSNCESVELLLNGKSLGAQPLPEDAAPRHWRVPFEPGTIEAVGKNHGKIVATHQLLTAGKPARIILTASRTHLTPTWDDVSYVTATVADEHGVRIPGADDVVTFKLNGPGRIAAVDNGDNTSHEPFQADSRRAYDGECIAILKALKSGGPLTLTASAPNLAPATIQIETIAANTKRALSEAPEIQSGATAIALSPPSTLVAGLVLMECGGKRSATPLWIFRSGRPGLF